MSKKNNNNNNNDEMKSRNDSQITIPITILLTSIAWIIIDIYIIYSYGDLINQKVNLLKGNIVIIKPINRIIDNDDVVNVITSSEIKKEQSNSNNKWSQVDSIYGELGTKVKFIGSDKFQEDFKNRKINPTNWPGENGAQYHLTKKFVDESKRRFSENQFDIVVSDKIALNRTVPEQRSASCQKKVYPIDLPDTSIIIVYHNEGETTLHRTLVSVLRQSPLKLIKEIILIDDASEDRTYLHEPLDNFIKTLPVTIKIIRNKERSGLMKARMMGARLATGDTLTFLDSHIEASNGWLPPLLYEIKMNRHVVVCPIIDVIKYDYFDYLQGSEAVVGAFDKQLKFYWEDASESENIRRKGDKSLPLRTPVAAGGLYTVDREYFFEMGAYDEGMDIWGADNLEMSFRV
jgi:polypeptide N-acetylgalactosaminyltransferase